MKQDRLKFVENFLFYIKKVKQLSLKGDIKKVLSGTIKIYLKKGRAISFITSCKTNKNSFKARNNTNRKYIFP